MSLRPRITGVLVLALAACSAPPATLTKAHADAIRDSVNVLVTAHAGLMRDYPASQEARAKAPLVFTKDVLYAGTIGSSMPVIMQGVDSVLMGDRPRWLRAYQWMSDRVIVRPLAPGAAAITEMYHEVWTDTTGKSATLRGVMTMATRHTTDGWRIVQFQAANTPESEAAIAALARPHLVPPSPRK